MAPDNTITWRPSELRNQSAANCPLQKAWATGVPEARPTTCHLLNRPNRQGLLAQWTKIKFFEMTQDCIFKKSCWWAPIVLARGEKKSWMRLYKKVLNAQQRICRKGSSVFIHSPMGVFTPPFLLQPYLEQNRSGLNPAMISLRGPVVAPGVLWRKDFEGFRVVLTDRRRTKLWTKWLSLKIEV